MQQLPSRRRPDGGRSLFRDRDFLDEQMQRLLGTMPLWGSVAESSGWAPRVDFAEENGHFSLTAELPGVQPDDVDLEVEGSTLTIRGSKKIEREVEDERVHLSERWYGTFERSFTLPSSANPEDISAEFQHGVLRVRIAKRAEARGKKIQVKTT